MIRSSNDDTKFLHIVAGVLQSDTYLPTAPLGQDMTQGQFLSRV